MPPTQTYCTFTYTGDNSIVYSFKVRQPIFDYTTKIEMPIKFQKQDGANYGSFDFGKAYDIRSCNATFILDYADAIKLGPLWVDTTGRSRTWTMELAANSGFFPFGADKADVGVFSVALVPENTFQTGMAPLRWHRITFNIYNVGAYPALYAFQTDDSEGRMTFGTVTNCRPPDAWFTPSYDFSSSTVILPGGGVEYRNQGKTADTITTGFTFRGKAAKTQRVLDYLTQTIRNDTFTFSPPAGCYPFGLSAGNGPFNVRILQSTLNITHSQHNIFTMDLQLEKR